MLSVQRPGHPDISLPNHYMRQLLALVKSRGVDTTALLQQAGIAQNVVEQTDANISWQQFYHLLQLCCSLSKEPALGLYLGSQLTIATHGLLGLAAISSSDVQQALQLICRYISTRSPLISLSLQQHRQQARLVLSELHPLAGLSAFVTETVMVALHNVLQVISDGQYQLRQVQFAFATPGYCALYEAFFPCPVRFGQPEHAIIFDSKYLTLKPPLSDTQVQQQLTAQCEQELSRQQQRQSLSGRIQLLLGRTKGRMPDIAQVAAEFALSERTLRRRLTAEHTSYQQLVAQWRQQMAEHYLQSTTLPIQQIAYLLGYADPSNFGRAFRQQSGQSPLQFRQPH